MAELNDCSKHVLSSATDMPAPSPWDVGGQSAHMQPLPQPPDRGSLTPVLPRIVDNRFDRRHETDDYLIRPAAAAVRGKPGDNLDNSIKANVAQGVDRLKRLDPTLE
jgi:hypothetical protein